MGIDGRHAAPWKQHTAVLWRETFHFPSVLKHIQVSNQVWPSSCGRRPPPFRPHASLPPCLWPGPGSAESLCQLCPFCTGPARPVTGCRCPQPCSFQLSGRLPTGSGPREDHSTACPQMQFRPLQGPPLKAGRGGVHVSPLLRPSSAPGSTSLPPCDPDTSEQHACCATLPLASCSPPRSLRKLTPDQPARECRWGREWFRLVESRVGGASAPGPEGAGWVPAAACAGPRSSGDRGAVVPGRQPSW